MFEHLRVVFQSEETRHGNIWHLVQGACLPCRRSFTHTLRTSALDSSINRSVWRCVQENFLELLNDSTTRDAFITLSLTKFRSKMSELHPHVADVPVTSSLMSPSTYFCSEYFSATFCMKSKLCARLCVKDDLRVSLSEKYLPNRGPGLDVASSDFTLTLFHEYCCVILPPFGVQFCLINRVSLNSMLSVVSSTIVCHYDEEPGRSFQDKGGTRREKSWEPLH